MSLETTAIDLQERETQRPRAPAITPIQVQCEVTPARRLESLPFQVRRWASGVLLLADLLSMQAAVALAWLVHGLMAPAWALPSSAYAALAVGVTIVHLASATIGLYAMSGAGPVERLRRRTLVHGWTLAALVLWTVMAAGPLPLTLLVAVFCISVCLCPLVDEAARAGLSRIGALGVPVVVLGAGMTGRLLVKKLRQHPTLGLVPIAVFDDDPRKTGLRIYGVPVLGPLAQARTLAGRVNLALVAMPGAGCDRLTELCHRIPFPRLLLVPDLIGLASLSVSGRDLGGVLGLEVRKPLQLRRHWWVKRSTDLALGIPLLILTLPLIALLGLIVRLISHGSPFYSQKRVGLGGRTIHILKLRTMYHDADERLERHLSEDPKARLQWDRYFKLKEDPRILPGIGHFLRRTSLDELPQLWNVIKGEMSLVGPRPFPLYHLSIFSPRFRTLRRSVRPGLTGMWQVSIRSNGDTKVQEAMDTYYIRNWSIWLDLHLLARTIWAVITGRGSC